jgi:hypothetical protein
MNHAGAILADRHAQRLAARERMFNKQSASSIEMGVTNTSIKSIELNALAHKHQPADECFECLPREIDDLIDTTGKQYRRKYRSMIKQGYLRQLLQLVRYTRSMEAEGKLREDPCHFFAKYAKKDNWKRTLEHLAKLAKVQETAVRVAAKLRSEVTKFIYREVWRGVNVERWADTAAEVGRNRPAYFAWLCRRESAACAVALV